VSTYEHDGLSLHYDVIGSGPDVVCVHGASGTGAYEWSALAGALSDRHRMILPDLRGHGASDYRMGEVSIELVNGDLLELIDHERAARPHVVGFSFGSEVVLDLELTNPGTCASLVLISPGLGDPKNSVPTREQLTAGWPKTLRRLHVDRHGEDHWLELMVELCERAGRRPKADLGALAGIACPILLVVGDQDDPRRVRQADLMVESHPHCTLVTIEGGRHAVHKDRPDEVAAAVGAFLDSIPSADVRTTGPGPVA
jgi:pimeloyl-ACP methyl ester carboxylesterase